MWTRADYPKGTALSTKYSLCYLHRWMRRNAINYPDLTGELVQEFIRRPNGRLQTIPSQKTTLTRVYAYLSWRHKRHPLSFDPQLLFPAGKTRLRQYAPESVFRFCEARKDYWGVASLRMAYHTAANLHRWMHWNQLGWQDLTPERIQRFFEKPCKRKVSLGSVKLLRRYTRHYTLWLHENGLIATDPRDFLPQPLHTYFRVPCDPVSAETVERFIEDRQAKGFRDRPAKYRYILKRFHSWLGRAGVPLAKVGDGALDEFLILSKGQGSSHRYRSFSRKYLRNYLGWLHEVGEITLQQPNLFLVPGPSASPFI